MAYYTFTYIEYNMHMFISFGFFFNSKLFIHEFHYMYVVGIKKILYEKGSLVSFMHIFIFFISNDIGKLILLYFYTSDAITVDI